MYKYIVLVGILLQTNNVFAQDTRATDMLLYGVATRSCGQFLKAQELENGDYGFYVSWLQGYLSAINLHRVYKRQDIGKATEVTSMMLFIKNHCSQRPLDNFALSVLKLTSELNK